jgi:16S rRNA (guanine527-N7)-methyltransferase
VKRGPSGENAHARLETVATRHSLDEVALGRLGAVLAQVSDDPHAPTSVRDPAEVVDVHIADSLSALPVLDDLAPRTIVDVGSGAGFPGVPIAVARPWLAVDLVEASRRSCDFLVRLLAAVGLERLRVVHRRAEEWAREDGRTRYDVVVVRAVAPLPVLLEYAAPLLRDGGTMIAWKGGEDEPGASEAADLLGMEATRVVPTRPYPGSRDRRLYLYRRVRPLPAQVPRRPGMARKRPLGRRAAG